MTKENETFDIDVALRKLSLHYVYDLNYIESLTHCSLITRVYFRDYLLLNLDKCRMQNSKPHSKLA